MQNKILKYLSIISAVYFLLIIGIQLIRSNNDELAFDASYVFDRERNFINQKWIHIITPTFYRTEQIADLTRMANSLILGTPNIHWIVVEHVNQTNGQLRNFLRDYLKLLHDKFAVRTKQRVKVLGRSSILFGDDFLITYLQLPSNYSLSRGIDHRNFGLEWILKTHKFLRSRHQFHDADLTDTLKLVNPQHEEYLFGKGWKSKIQKNHSNLLHKILSLDSLIYFADDDNTYGMRLFEEIRKTRKIRLWSVGIVGNLLYEKPICRNNKVVRFFSIIKVKSRKFPIDMASFSISLNYLLSRNEKARFVSGKKSRLETDFLESLRTSYDDLEAECSNKINVWHTKTVRSYALTAKQLNSFGLTYDKKY
ncbi:hypothetical protein SNEBB_007405 [Seison nebaliae]|nr:hypothetical protein SNEBB_007405 [Seison nebaliae]